MASVSLKEKIKGTLKSVSTKSFSSKVFNIFLYENIYEKNRSVKNIKQSSYPVTKIHNIKINVKTKEVLPFRVKFTNIGILGTTYGPNNPAPIGIAVIGFNNYIL
jgi:hypothetical protein